MGRAAVESLVRAGVEQRCQLQPSRRSRVIFEAAADGTHTFHDRCFVCDQRPRLAEFARAREEKVRVSFRQGDLVCVDRLTADRVHFIRRARAAGALTAIDCGRLGHLRYMPVVAIAALFSEFDVVLMTARVARSIAGRLQLQSSDELPAVLKTRCFVISSGAHGATIYTQSPEGIRSQSLPAPSTSVADDAGAGDRLFSVVLREVVSGVLPNALADAVRQRYRDCLAPVLSSVGARGYLPQTSAMPEILKPFVDASLDDIRTSVAKEPCPFCNTAQADEAVTSPSRAARPGVRRNVGLLMTRALFAAERRDALVACEELLDLPGTAFVVGSGGSYPAAAFWALAFNRATRVFAQSIRPLDYVRMRKPTDLVVLISYSGRGADIRRAASTALEIGARRVVMITGGTASSVTAVLPQGIQVVSYALGERDNRERGFVSIAGTVAPCALLLAAISGLGALNPLHTWATEALQRLPPHSWFEAVRDHRTLDVIGGDVFWPAMLDLESKCVEGNLARVVLHEEKDFSHGRFMLTLNAARPNRATEKSEPRTSALLFRSSTEFGYEQELAKVLRRNTVFAEVRPVDDGLTGALQALFAVQYLVRAIGDALHVDIARPDVIPAGGRRLYRWNGPLPT